VIISVIVAVAGFVFVLINNYHPVLGLDLQGGASVVFQPARKVSQSEIDQTIAILNDRVNALGVAEPSIGQQGSDIVVQLPGIKDPRRALNLIGQTAQLQFRPVLCIAPNYIKPPKSIAAKVAHLSPSCPSGSNPQSASLLAYIPNTSPLISAAHQNAIYPQFQGHTEIARYVVGPQLLGGNAIKSVVAAPNPSEPGFWAIDFTLTPKASPIFDAIAKAYYHRQLAIVLDGVVESAPVIDQTNFGGQGQISGQFSEQQAQNLVLILKYGALPVPLKEQTVQTVSATLGKGALKAGLTAGLAGLVLVLIYTAIYYRLLGVVVAAGLAVTFGALWTVVAYLGHRVGLTLDLSGVTGIIVSIGVIVDSYVVFFERLKDETRGGRSLRASVDTGFKKAFRTIVAADLVSFIGAALLYIFSIGPVKGFAFFLGLATVLDVLSAWFFTRPLVLLMASLMPSSRYRWLGVPAVAIQAPEAKSSLIRPSRRAKSETSKETR
jgi:preprotein translocase subunit SecD